MGSKTLCLTTEALNFQSAVALVERQEFRSNISLTGELRAGFQVVQLINLWIFLARDGCSETPKHSGYDAGR